MIKIKQSGPGLKQKPARSLVQIHDAALRYFATSQDFTPGEYYGSFWSEKGYHGPLLNWHGGGSHHHRGAGSAALALWLTGKQNNDSIMKYHAELAFDWLAARQHVRGGWFEIQNNEKPSNWENTGLEELSTIEGAFVIHGLGNALLSGLPPKKSYMDCLIKAGHWFLSLEWPCGSGIFPHHERSPYDTLNANAHAVESLATIYQCLNVIYKKDINIFREGTRRGFVHTLPLQWKNGCYPYRRDDGITINYTSLVLWCLLNTLDVLPKEARITAWPGQKEIKAHFTKAASFLSSCVAPNGQLKWDGNETSTAKHNMWTYAITYNVLRRIHGKTSSSAADKLLRYILSSTTACNLLPMRDQGEEITHCLFMQADMFLFLFTNYNQIIPG